MPDKIYELYGVRIMECDAEGKPLRSDRDAVDLMGEAWPHRVNLLAVPVSRLDEDFFRLKTRIAGEIIQKFLTYGFRLAIVGDISRYVDESDALRGFVVECNRGAHTWFAKNLEELEARLKTAGNSAGTG
jgi:Domain of unknown function (DUF4180)